MWPYLPSMAHPWVPTYYLFTSFAFIAAIYWGVLRARKKNLNPHTVLDLALVIMIGAFIGGRLFHIFFENPHFFERNPLQAFAFWNGGFVFYGGFWGALLAVFIYDRIHPFDFFTYADLLAPVVALGYGIGRIGCFSAGCCYGKSTSVPWTVVFPPWSQANPLIPLHPTQLYSVAWEWMTAAILLNLEKRNSKKATQPIAGTLFAVWLMLHGLGRGIIEQFRGDFRGENVFNLSISTWISMLIILGGMVLYKRKRRA